MSSSAATRAAITAGRLSRCKAEPIGQVNRRQRSRVAAMGGEGALEAAALGGGADQAGIGEVAAAEDGFGDLEIQRVQWVRIR